MTLFLGGHSGVRTDGLKCLKMSARTEETAGLCPGWDSWKPLLKTMESWGEVPESLPLLQPSQPALGLRATLGQALEVYGARNEHLSRMGPAGAKHFPHISHSGLSDKLMATRFPT